VIRAASPGRKAGSFSAQRDAEARRPGHRTIDHLLHRLSSGWSHRGVCTICGQISRIEALIVVPGRVAGLCAHCRQYDPEMLSILADLALRHDHWRDLHLPVVGRA
jgi:hypothetical protein